MKELKAMIEEDGKEIAIWEEGTSPHPSHLCMMGDTEVLYEVKETGNKVYPLNVMIYTRIGGELSYAGTGRYAKDLRSALAYLDKIITNTQK